MRAAKTILAVAIGVAFIVAIFLNGRPHPKSDAPDGTEPVVASQPAGETPLAAAPLVAAVTSAASPAPTTASATSTPTDTAAPAPTASTVAVSPQATTEGGLTLPFHAVSDNEARVATLGSNDPKSGYKLQADLSAWGASVLFLSLTDYHTQVTGGQPYIVQQALRDPSTTQTRFLFPFAANSIEVNGHSVDLVGQKWTLTEPSAFRTSLLPEAGAKPAPLASKAVYTIDIVDALGAKVLTLTRTYSLAPAGIVGAVEKKGYELRCDQRITNLTSQPLKVVWHQNAQADVPDDDNTTGLGNCSYVAGYHDLDYDPNRTHIFTNKAFLGRTDVLNASVQGHPFWPNHELKQKSELVWLGSVNRYFTTVTHRPLPDDPNAGVLALQDQFPTQGMIVLGQAPGSHSDKDLRAAAFTLSTKPLDVAPGKSAALDLCLFAGPRENKLLNSASYERFSFDHLIVYQLGCTWCTFQPLAKGLLWFLKGIHWATHDWSLAIIALVLVVRLILHPITKRSQINMAKMSKQMASLQPELEKIKKKYKDDPDKLNSETFKLYREKNISYSGALGCVPMLLQAPIWIAFYAMIYFAIELRHQPAFYGFFQWISGGKWAFLKDLSASDNLILFPHQIDIPIPFLTTIHLTGINLIPLLLGVVFYYQQKLTMPPAQTEQQKQQQGIMKWMTLLFPFMLYSMPSGLTLYMCASTGAGIVDSLIVKRHIKREEEAGRLFAPAPPPKPGSWRAKLGEFMVRAQQMQEEQKRQQRDKK